MCGILTIAMTVVAVALSLLSVCLSVCRLWSVQAAVPTTGCRIGRKPLLYIRPPRGASWNVSSRKSPPSCKTSNPRWFFFRPFFSLSRQTFCHRRRSIRPHVRNDNFRSTIFFVFFFSICIHLRFACDLVFISVRSVFVRKNTRSERTRC